MAYKIETLNAVCACCMTEAPIENCKDWRGWEYDKRNKKAFGLCESCKGVFKLYDGIKTIDDMIRESECETRTFKRIK